MSRSISDVMQNKSEYDYNLKNSENNTNEVNYPTKLFNSFMNDKNTHNSLKNSRYINNYPSTTLLNLKRFFNSQEQNKIFSGFKSSDKSNSINNKTNTFLKKKI